MKILEKITGKKKPEEGRDEKGQFTQGNNIHECRAQAGPGYKYPPPDGAEKLLKEFELYKLRVDNNTLMVHKGQKTKGKPDNKTGKQKADGFEKNVGVVEDYPCIPTWCFHIGIAQSTWYRWKEEREDLAEAIEFIEDAIIAYKERYVEKGFGTGKILSRQLGDPKRVSMEISGPDRGPITTAQITGEMKPSDAATLYRQMIRKPAKK